MATKRLLVMIGVVLLATAVPAFGAPASTPPAHRVDFSGIRAAAAVRPIDVAGDGRADLVARTNPADDGTLWVYPNNGTATPWESRFLAGTQWRFANTLLLGDVNGDGRPDVVARDPAVGNGTLWIYPNDGSTTGNPWPTRYSAGTGWNAVDWMMLGDVTGDGRADILARDPLTDNGTLYVYPNSGAATGTNPFTVPRFWAGTGWDLATATMLGDVNGDGRPDIVARVGSDALWIYPNNGSTTADPYTSRYGAGTGWNDANTMLLGDVKGDGHPDIVTRDDSGDVWVYPNSGTTTGDPWTLPRVSAGGGWNFANALLLGDVNGDGKADLLARVGGGDLSLYPNNGTETPWTTSIPAGSGWDTMDALLLGDVYGDHRSELLARDPTENQGTLWIYPNNGSTTGDPWTLPKMWAGTGWNLATAMALGDLTGDGRPDILMRDSAGTLWVYPNNGATSGNPYTLARTWAGTGWNTARALTLGDVNGDGLADLIDQEQDGTMWIYLTDSSAPPIQVTGDWSDTNAIAVGDVDGHGRLDLVTRDSTGNLWIYPNNGSTTGDPWTIAPHSAGTAWSAATALLLS